MALDNMQNHIFPQNLNKPRRIIGLQMDEGICLIVSFIIGFFLSQALTFLIIGGGLVVLLKYFKKGKSSTHLYNAIYWYFPSCVNHRNFKKIPESYKRKWIK